MSASNDRLRELADELPADLAGEVVRFAEYLLARRAAEVAAGLPPWSPARWESERGILLAAHGGTEA